MMRAATLAGLISILLISSSLHADEESITELEAWSTGGKVSVSFVLEHAFDEQHVVAAVQSGLPTVIAYELELIRKRPNWFDTTIARARIETSATYNARTDEYLVNHRRDRKLVRSETASTFNDLVEKMTVIEEIDVLDRGNYPPYKTVVRVRAVLVRDLFFYMVPRSLTTRWELASVRSESRQP